MANRRGAIAIVWLAAGLISSAHGAGARTGAGALSIDVIKGPIPYDIDQRPMPNSQDPDILLPRQVGPYARRPFPRGLRVGIEDLNADYTDGRSTVNVGISITEKPKDAHTAIRTLRQEALGQRKRDGVKGAEARMYESIGTEPSFYKFDDFIAWSRGGYLYYAKASSAAALDRFMEGFPF